MPEITRNNLECHLARIDTMKFDQAGAESVFRFLMAMGATKDIRLYHCEDGTIKVCKDFKHQSAIIPLEGDDGWRTSQHYYPLETFLKTLIRFDKSAWKRMKNVEQKVNQMHAGIKALTKQM